MKYIKVGKIVNTHGVKGEVRIISNFKFKNKVFKKGMNIYIGKDKTKEKINSYRPHKQFDMITMDGYYNINDILKYKGLNVYVDEKDLKLNDGEYLDEDLIGLKVMIHSEIKGIIKDIEDYKTYKLIVVNKDENCYLIPYVSDIIENIDFKEGIMAIKEELKGLFDK